MILRSHFCFDSEGKINIQFLIPFPPHPSASPPPSPQGEGFWKCGKANCVGNANPKVHFITQAGIMPTGKAAFRFMLPVENYFVFSINMRKDNFYRVNRLRILGPGTMSLARGCRGCGSPCKGSGEHITLCPGIHDIIPNFLLPLRHILWIASLIQNPSLQIRHAALPAIADQYVPANQADSCGISAGTAV